MKDKLRNPVAKYNNEVNKPKTFRDRKKEYKRGEEKRDHPLHEPYHRTKVWDYEEDTYDYGADDIQ